MKTKTNLYGGSKELETRMLAIRDAHPNRPREIARQHSQDSLMTFQEEELIWIDEAVDRHRNPLIPHLEPNEYWPLISALAFHLKMTRIMLRNVMEEKPGSKKMAADFLKKERLL